MSEFKNVMATIEEQVKNAEDPTTGELDWAKLLTALELDENATVFELCMTLIARAIGAENFDSKKAAYLLSMPARQTTIEDWSIFDALFMMDEPLEEVEHAISELKEV